MPRSNNHLRVRLQSKNCIERREPLCRAIGLGRQAQVKRHDIGFPEPQRINRTGAVARHDHVIIVIGPAQLTLQPLVILDDQQFGFLGVAIALSLSKGHATKASCQVVGVESQIINRVPCPGSLSTVSRPPIAEIIARASNAPMPKPPSLVEANGRNS